MNKNNFLQDNLIFLVMPVVILILGIYFSYQRVTLVMNDYNTIEEQKQLKITKESKFNQLATIKRNQDNMEKTEKVSKSGKVIYEVLGQQFSPEASFGIMFENILSNLTNSGVRIRLIDYNYSPQEDKILLANAAGYNACELSFTAVSSYSQLQTFFKNIMKENYLTNIYEVYIEPYDRDKTILISKFKIRLYTKTVQG